MNTINYVLSDKIRSPFAGSDSLQSRMNHRL
nr:MAG TPA: hypothetical protein [Caudoviricetes sp.]